MDDKFSKYRRSTEQQRAATWPGWVAVAVLLAAAIGVWMHAIPVYFSSKKSSGRAGGLPGHTNISGWKKPGELAVVFLDIGQGDAAFIQTPKGKNILIDSGEGKTPDSKFLKAVDAAGRVILPFFKQIGVRHIDIVVTSHPHSDHMGSMHEILGEKDLTFGEVWISGFVHNTSSNKKMLNVIKRRKIPLYVPKMDELPVKLDAGPEVAAYILYADANAESANNSSIILKLTYGHVSFIFTGDAEEDEEKACVVRWGNTLKSDILKVGHHGSKTSSSQILLNQVKPDAAVISVGSYNTFGHPNANVMQRLTDMGAKVYRTDEQGSIFVFSDGKTYRIEPSKL